MPTLGLPLREALRIDAARPVAGGCIHRTFEVQIGARAFFLKTNEAQHADAFAAEADGLAALRRAGLRAPEPLSHGVVGEEAYLLLEALELRSTGDFTALARMLATAHRSTGLRFGWARDNYIGATPQTNGWHEDWATFWLERRLRPQLALARKNGFALAEPPLKVLEGRQPGASLLHGDLWRGNAAFTAAGPVMFDPAVYYGDREADLAMTELFGGFPPEFYRAYGEAFPLERGYEERKQAYNLYHLLNHLNLFGAGYLGRVKQALGFLRGSL